MIKLRTIKIKNIDFSVSLKTKIITLFIFISSLLNAATITSNYTGNWSSSATWVGGVVPGATDNVIIASNHVVTVNGTYSCANLTIGSNGSSPTLRVTVAANSLTINGILTMNAGNFNGTYTLDAGPGTVNINGTVSWASTSGTNLIETTSSGTLNFGSAITISKSSQNVKVTASGGTVKFNADVTDQQNKISIVAGGNSYFAGSYTVNTTATTLFASTSNTYFTGSGKSLVTDAAVTFGHCFIDANASVSTSGSSNITVAGNFELASGSIFTLGNNLYVKLNWTNNGGTLAGGHNHVYLTASNSTIRNINGPYLTTFPNLHIGTPSGSWAVKYNLNTDMTC
ncbi:MAG TPA: hypothetical protein VLB84_00920, partial [Bacteroidia bacterium]|nr:hypothetical protein [Bacteroidia bacterium]